MSFSKAKRFNELKDPTPSPTKYDPKLEKKAVCASISKSERFPDTPKAGGDAAVNTTQTPIFRTPLPYRKPLVRSVSNVTRSCTKSLFKSDVSSRSEPECSDKHHSNEELEFRQEDQEASKITQLLEENAVLKSNIDVLTVELERTKVINADLISEMNTLNTQLSHPKKELMLLGFKYQENLNKVEILSSEVQSVKAVNKQLISENEKLQTENRGITENSKSLISTLEQKLCEIKNQNHKYEIAMSDTRSSLDVLGKRLIESEHEVEKLNNENQTVKNQVLELTDSIKEKENVINNYKSEMRAKVSQLDNEVAMLKMLVTTLEDENKTLKTTGKEKDMFYFEKLTEFRNKINHTSEVSQSLMEIQINMIDSMEDEFITEIEELKTFCVTNLESYITSTLNQIETLGEINSKLLKDNEILEVNVNDLKEKLETLNTDHDVLKTTYDIVTTKYHEVEVQNEELVNENNLLRIELAHLQEEKEHSKTEHQGLMEKISNLEGKMIQMQMVVDDVNRKKHETQIKHDSLKRDLVSLIEEKQDIENSRLSLLNSIELMEKEKIENDRKFNEVEKKLNGALAELECLKTKLHDSEFQFENLKMTTDECTQVANTKIQKLMAKIDMHIEEQSSLKKVLLHKDEKLSNFTDIYNSTLKLNEERIQKLTEGLAESEIRLDCLMMCYNEASDEINTLEEKCKELKDMNGQLQTKLCMNDTLNDHLKTSIHDLQVKNDELETRLNVINVKNKELQDLQELNEKLKTRITILEETIKTEQENLKKRSKAFDEELENVTTRKEYYKTSCMKFEKRISDLRSEMTYLRQNFKEKEDLMLDLETYKEKMAELEVSVERMKVEIENYQEERKFLESELVELRELHLQEAAKSGHRNHKQKIQYVVKLKNEVLELKKQNEKLQVEKAAQKKTIAKYQELAGHTSKRLFVGGKRPMETPFKGKENTEVKSDPPSPALKTRNN